MAISIDGASHLMWLRNACISLTKLEHKANKFTIQDYLNKGNSLKYNCSIKAGISQLNTLTDTHVSQTHVHYICMSIDGQTHKYTYSVAKYVSERGSDVQCRHVIQYVLLPWLYICHGTSILYTTFCVICHYCLHIYVYACMHVFMYMQMCLCLWTCVCRYACMCMNVWMYV